MTDEYKRLMATLNDFEKSQLEILVNGMRESDTVRGMEPELVDNVIQIAASAFCFGVAIGKITLQSPSLN